MISNDKKSFHFDSQAGPESTWPLKVRRATAAQHRMAEPPTGGGTAANSGGIRLVTYWAVSHCQRREVQTWKKRKLELEILV